MNGRQEILDELRALASPLAGMPCAMPFDVPDGYFKSLATEITSASKAAEISDTTFMWTHEHPYKLPEGYFEHFSADILNNIKEQEFVQSLPFDNPMDVPAGYFESLPLQVLAAAKKTEKAKSRSVKSFWFQLKWAAAALLVCGIGIGSYKMLMPTSMPVIANPEQALAKMPPKTIHEYIQQNIDDYDVDFIMSNANPNNIQALTKQLDQQEVQEYLNATGWEQSE